ncbi:MAG: hypothetical protein Q9166_007642 [cf. Caloplaca sp. 2 TL-2023]
MRLVDNLINTTTALCGPRTSKYEPAVAYRARDLLIESERTGKYIPLDEGWRETFEYQIMNIARLVLDWVQTSTGLGEAQQVEPAAAAGQGTDDNGSKALSKSWKSKISKMEKHLTQDEASSDLSALIRNLTNAKVALEETKKGLAILRQKRRRLKIFGRLWKTGTFFRIRRKR